MRRRAVSLTPLGERAMCVMVGKRRMPALMAGGNDDGDEEEAESGDDKRRIRRRSSSRIYDPTECPIITTPSKFSPAREPEGIRRARRAASVSVICSSRLYGVCRSCNVSGTTSWSCVSELRSSKPWRL